MDQQFGQQLDGPLHLIGSPKWAASHPARSIRLGAQLGRAQGPHSAAHKGRMSHLITLWSLSHLIQAIHLALLLGRLSFGPLLPPVLDATVAPWIALLGWTNIFGPLLPHLGHMHSAERLGFSSMGRSLQLDLLGKFFAPFTVGGHHFKPTPYWPPHLGLFIASFMNS
ncbi:hypothetical protein Salat_2724800 [Sesamum alatum]|uniref:Uncharacterized protein n=1 Tax=Sesamum alatum TaxID=300844 RepID=A0AAE1XR96_9LAMI|nr:hypothetical protein Salat_2724800 [Sesamum alatum]